MIADLKRLTFGGGTEAARQAITRAVSGHGASSSYIQAVVKKYQELIHNDDLAGNPLGLIACPECGAPIREEVEVLEHPPKEEDNISDFIVCHMRCIKCDWSAIV